MWLGSILALAAPEPDVNRVAFLALAEELVPVLETGAPVPYELHTVVYKARKPWPPERVDFEELSTDWTRRQRRAAIATLLDVQNS